MLKPIITTCTPRADVLAGGLTDNHFAAQLDKIVRDPGNYPVYGDPEQFFAITHPTKGLYSLLTKTFGRITKTKGEPGESGVLRPTTSFGGGKTHGLTAIYHLAKGARPKDIDTFVDSSVLPKGQVQVAALVGDALDPVAGVTTNGFKTYTLWGEMAAQIGADAYKVLEANDRERSAPSTHTIRDAFGGRPTVIIIDEVAQYLRQVTSSGNEDVRRMAGAIVVFLKNLFEVAADPDNCAIAIVTLAVGTSAFGTETDEINELMDESSASTKSGLSEIHDVLSRDLRPSAMINPADDNEIGEILKRRLFENVDEKAAKAAGDEFQSLYENLIRNESLAGGPEKPATYALEVARSYPFHPELIRVLDRRLGAIPQFQRTRGALKLLAEVVADIWGKKKDLGIINVADIDYGNPSILNHLTVGLSRAEFSTVAQADIAGSTAHSVALDAEVFPERPPYSTRVGRTVFAHSLELTANAGASRNDWIIGTLLPGEDVSLIEKALNEAEKRFWHLVYDGSKYRFTPEPNVIAIIETEKQNIANTQVSALVDDLVKRAFPNDGNANVIHFATGPSDVSDEAKLRFVVMHHSVLSVNPKEAESAPLRIVEILDSTGSSGAPRKFRNSVVFVLADELNIEVLKDRARAQIASDILATDSARMAQFSEEIRKKIEQYQKEAQLQGRIAVTRCYKHIYYPSGEKSSNYLRHRDLPAQQQGNVKTTGTEAVLRLLSDEGKIRSDQLSASYLKSKAWPDAQSSVSTQSLSDWFWIDHGSQMIVTLPPIREAITSGIRNEGWVYFDSSVGKAWTATSMSDLKIEFRTDTELMSVSEATKRGLLVRKPTQADLLSLTFDPFLSGAQIRSALELKCGGEPSKGDVLEAISTAVQAYEYGRLVVTDVEPQSGVRALTPSEISKRGLDGLFVMDRAHADSQGVEIPTRTATGKTFTASGAGGQAIQSITDQISDFTIKTVSRIELKSLADDHKGTKDLDLLVACLGMLPSLALIANADVKAEFPNWMNGGMKVQGSAARADFQKSWTNISKLFSQASAVGGAITLTVDFSPPVSISTPDYEQLAKIVKEIGLQYVEIRAEVSK